MSRAHPLLARQARQCRQPGCAGVYFFALMPSGKWTPLDLEPDPIGNVAVRVDATGTVRGRALTHERPVAEGAEKLHVPHFATCSVTKAPARQEGNVVSLYAVRAARRNRSAR